MEIIDALIAHPACLFMTDSVVSMQGIQNPASFGAFPLLLQYSRDRNLIPLEGAVRKMTGASAERLGVKDRGVLKKGLAADITVFDREQIKDNNTVTETDQEPEGIEAVFINGIQVKKDGLVEAAALAGKVVDCQ
jgi:N-acyl-D-aspartate/D-glutamate deacylase